ncbi:MAG: hypothetical protein K0S76_885 [Herbinix sp.]|jgi:uncharacterized protein YbjQ (UPF0145 family)|nr:hypothetical protein [Herbinix sp.]
MIITTTPSVEGKQISDYLEVLPDHLIDQKHPYRHGHT